MAQKNVNPNTPQAKENTPFVFGRSNYRILLLSIAVVITGFLLMIGDTDIYSTRKIVIAPIVVLAGFALGFVAILRKPEIKD